MDLITNKLSWADDQQLDVIKSDPDERIVVEAGPGTGKTAVACARVAYLVDQKYLSPSKIWLFSFTRTAVKEIRDRIQNHISDEASALSVKITTLDSQIWYLRQGFDEQDIKQLLKSYEANIQRIIDLLKNDDDNLADFLEEIEHVIIDEAQDFVGIRSELLSNLIKKLHSSCGVTVFADSAQAIYGFTDEDGKGISSVREPVAEYLLSGDYGGFKKKFLKQIHRTSNEQLLNIFTRVRDLVLSESSPAEEKIESIKDEITKVSVEDLPRAERQNLLGRKDVLLLYRTRAEVLQASSFLWGTGIPHKLRMSGLCRRMHPWLGRIFFDYKDRKITPETFTRLWSKRIIGTDYSEMLDLDIAWHNLANHAADKNGNIVIRKLRQILSRSRPPIEFMVDEYYLDGPTVGTIHASKGRESDDVHLMLPVNFSATEDMPESQIDEEGRVVFVGATRAKKTLKVGKSSPSYVSKLERSNRVYKLGYKNKSPRAQVEFGLETDVDKYAQVSDTWSKDYIFNNQQFLWMNCISRHSVLAVSSKNTNYFFHLYTNDSDRNWIGCLSKNLSSDLWDIGEYVARHYKSDNRRPGNKINHLNMSGARTVVLPEDDEQCVNLESPYSETGIFLVPYVVGFTIVFFNVFKKY